MKFTIVTISYNQGSFVEEAIRSVLDQNVPNLEYIVLDAGSTDESRDIISAYESRLDRVIFAPDNGPADGLNKGFSLARGDVYGFLNSDDYLLPGALQRVAAAFSAENALDVVSGNAVVVDQDGNQINRLVSRRFNLRQHVYGAATIAQPSTFFRASAFERTNGFNVNNRSNWDGELWIDLALSGASFGRIPFDLAAFRIYAESITGGGEHAVTSARYRDRMFKKVMGRERHRRDNFLGILYKAIEYATQPRVGLARLQWGPVVRRADSSGRTLKEDPRGGGDPISGS